MVGREVFGEVAAAVCGHQNLRAETGLSLNEQAGDATAGRNDCGEESGGAAADDCQFDGIRFHAEDYTILAMSALEARKGDESRVPIARPMI